MQKRIHFASQLGKCSYQHTHFCFFIKTPDVTERYPPIYYINFEYNVINSQGIFKSTAKYLISCKKPEIDDAELIRNQLGSVKFIFQIRKGRILILFMYSQVIRQRYVNMFNGLLHISQNLMSFAQQDIETKLKNIK